MQASLAENRLLPVLALHDAARALALLVSRGHDRRLPAPGPAALFGFFAGPAAQMH